MHTLLETVDASLPQTGEVCTFSQGAGEGLLPRQPSGCAVGERLRILGVDYWHSRASDGTDLFLTRHGRVHAPWLKPENWLAPEWFRSNRHRLRGTSVIYRVRTPAVLGQALDLVVRYSRVGETVPGDTHSNELMVDATFNSPFEEIARVEELRAARYGGGRRIFTKRPLAIVVPPKRLKPWQTHRSEEEISIKNAGCADAAVDIQRQYLLVYGWIKGCDAAQAADRLGLEGARRQSVLENILAVVTADLADAGFTMADIKPEHVIVRVTEEGQLLRRPDGSLVYALIDYELLERMEGVQGRSADGGFQPCRAGGVTS